MVGEGGEFWNVLNNKRGGNGRLKAATTTMLYGFSASLPRRLPHFRVIELHERKLYFSYLHTDTWSLREDIPIRSQQFLRLNAQNDRPPLTKKRKKYFFE